MRNLVRIQGHPHLRKDPHTKAILNTNPEALRRHAHHQQGADELKMRDHKIETLEDELKDLKRLVKRLLGE